MEYLRAQQPFSINATNKLIRAIEEKYGAASFQESIQQRGRFARLKKPIRKRKQEEHPSVAK